MPYTPQSTEKIGYYAYITLRAAEEGILDHIEIDAALEAKILERHTYIEPGNPIKLLGGMNIALGVIIVKFDSMKEMDDYVNRYSKLFNVILK